MPLKIEKSYSSTIGNPMYAFLSHANFDKSYEQQALFSRHNLSRILLPRHTRACWEKRDSGGVDCDYPAEVLFKMYRSQFENEFPDAAKFIQAMRFKENKDQEDILFQVSYGGAAFTDAACTWARKSANRDTWTNWIESVEKSFTGNVWVSA